MKTVFEELKVKLTSASVLSYTDYKKPFVVCTDASSRAVGSFFTEQTKIGEILSYIYGRRALSSAESNYSAFETDAYIVIFAFKEFRNHVTSNRFKVLQYNISIFKRSISVAQYATRSTDFCEEL